MSFDQLRQIKTDAEQHTAEKRRLERAAEYLSGVRRNYLSGSQMDALTRIHSSGYGGSPAARDALNDALAAVLPDVIRVAELNLAAKARDHQVRAAQLNAVIASSILPLPGLGGDQ